MSDMAAAEGFVQECLAGWAAAAGVWARLAAIVGAPGELAAGRAGGLTIHHRRSYLAEALSPLRSASVSGLGADDADVVLERVLEAAAPAGVGPHLHLHFEAVAGPGRPPAPGATVVNLVVGERRRAESPKLVRTIAPTVTLDDLVLPAAVVEQLRFLVRATRGWADVLAGCGVGDSILGRSARLVANFSGPPGTGKTLAAHALAGELGCPLVEVDYAQLESEYVGRTSKHVEQVFATAKEAGAVLFFDEADGFVGKRVTDIRQATDVAVNNTRAVMLTELERHDGLTMFATNLPSNYDRAFRRRILELVDFPLPDSSARASLLQRHIPEGVPGRDGLDWAELAALSEGLGGGDIANVAFRSVIEAGARDGDGKLTTDDVLRSIARARASFDILGDSIEPASGAE